MPSSSRWPLGPDNLTHDAGLDELVDSVNAMQAGGGMPPVGMTPSKPTPTVLTRFQAGHGYTFTGGQDAASNLNDTSDLLIGSQNVKLVTDGAGGSNCAVALGGQAIDLTGKSLRITYKISDYTRLSEIRIFAGDSALANGWIWIWEGQAPNINNFASDGEYVQITLSFADATVAGAGTRNSVAKLWIRATDTGGGNKVTVQLYAIDAVPEPTTIYPNGLVTITCDDGYQSHYDILRPALDKYGYAASELVICDLVGQPGRMSLSTLQKLQGVNGWDLCSHAYTVASHSLAQGLLSLSPSALDAEMSAMKSYGVANGFLAANIFGWPKGYYNQAAIDSAKKYFVAARSIAAKTPHETWTPADLYRLRSQSGICTTGGISLAAAKAQVDTTVTNKAWSIFTIHDIVPSAPAADQALTADIISFIDYLNTKGVAVKTLSAALKTP